MKTLSAKIIKSQVSTWNPKTNITTEGKGQTVIYQGSSLNVTWGGEYYTAWYKNMEFRNCSLKNLKSDIRELYTTEF